MFIVQPGMRDLQGLNDLQRMLGGLFLGDRQMLD